MRAKYYDVLRSFAEEGIVLYIGCPHENQESTIQESVKREKGADSNSLTLEALLKYIGALWRVNPKLIPTVLQSLKMLIFDKRATVQRYALLEFAALAESPITA